MLMSMKQLECLVYLLIEVVIRLWHLHKIVKIYQGLDSDEKVLGNLHRNNTYEIMLDVKSVSSTPSAL